MIDQPRCYGPLKKGGVRGEQVDAIVGNSSNYVGAIALLTQIVLVREFRLYLLQVWAECWAWTHLA